MIIDFHVFLLYSPPFIWQDAISGGGLPPWYRTNPAGSSMKPSQFRMVWSPPVHFLRKLHGRQEGQTAWFSMNTCLFVRFFSSNNCLGAWNDEKHDGKDTFCYLDAEGGRIASYVWVKKIKGDDFVMTETVSAEKERCDINYSRWFFIRMFSLSSISGSEHKQIMNQVEWHFQKLVASRYVMCAIVWQCCSGLWNLHPVYVRTFLHSFLCYFIMR